MTKLHADSITKNFGELRILTDVFISCKKGEVVGILGRNGSGKSTLMKIIFGALSANTSFVKVENRIMKNLYNRRNEIKYLPQFNFLPSHIKIKNLIRLLNRNSNEQLLKNNKHILPFLDSRPKQLSSGEKRLIEIILIIHSEAKYVLIDEPFNGIAPKYKEEIKDLIRKMSATKGFIITDHDYRNVLDLATKKILIVDGITKEIKNNDELKIWGYMPFTSTIN